MATLPLLTDGDFSARLLIAPTRITRPFLNHPTKDTATKLFERIYELDRASYSPFAALATLPDEGSGDAADAAAYLLEEGEPELEPDGTQRVRCLFGHVPPQQTVPGMVKLTKPAPPTSGTFPKQVGSYLVAKPDSLLEKFDAYLKKLVTSDTGAPGLYPTGGTYTLTFAGNTTGALNYNDAAATVEAALDALTSVSNRGGCAVAGSYNSAGGLAITFADYAAVTGDFSALTPATATLYAARTNGGYTQSVTISDTADITAGTFTLTIFGQTTAAIAYNATAATVQSALNALSEVSNRGNCTVSLPSGETTIQAEPKELKFTIAFANSVLTAISASLTPAGSTATPSITDGGVGRTQKVVFAASTATRDLYSAAHGITAGGTIYVKGGSTYYTAITAYTVPDVNTIRLLISPGDSYAAAGTITEVGQRTKEAYEPGVATVPSNRVTDYYLPGVTPGIATDADIPRPADQSGDAAFFEAVFAGSGTVNWEVGQLAVYRGPIRSLTKTTLLASDV